MSTSEHPLAGFEALLSAVHDPDSQEKSSSPKNQESASTEHHPPVLVNSNSVSNSASNVSFKTLTDLMNEWRTPTAYRLSNRAAWEETVPQPPATVSPNTTPVTDNENWLQVERRQLEVIEATVRAKELEAEEALAYAKFLAASAARMRGDLTVAQKTIDKNLAVSFTKTHHLSNNQPVPALGGSTVTLSPPTSLEPISAVVPVSMTVDRADPFNVGLPVPPKSANPRLGMHNVSRVYLVTYDPKLGWRYFRNQHYDNDGVPGTSSPSSSKSLHELELINLDGELDGVEQAILPALHAQISAHTNSRRKESVVYLATYQAAVGWKYFRHTGYAPSVPGTSTPAEDLEQVLGTETLEDIQNNV